MTKGRLGLAVVIVALAGWLVYHVSRRESEWGKGFSNPGRPPVVGFDRPVAMTRSEECRACHAEVFDEWDRSHHRMAYVNPDVQKLSKGFQDKDCLPCHLPRPVLETGLGVRVLERATTPDDGVDCFTCHHDPAANAMIGPGPLGPSADKAPCQPCESEIIRSRDLCAPCHNQHKVHEEWRQTRFAVPGEGFKDCNDCHMPKVERKAAPGRKGGAGRSHVFPAAHDPAMLKTAAELSVEAAGAATLLIRVVNSGAGHNFPTDERHRTVDLLISAVAGDGQTALARIDRYRNPYRTEFEFKNPLRSPGAQLDTKIELGALGSIDAHIVRVPAEFNPEREPPYYPESTQIPSGEARSYRLVLPPAVREATVRLLYRTNPFLPDAEAVVLHERTVRVP